MLLYMHNKFAGKWMLMIMSLVMFVPRCVWAITEDEDIAMLLFDGVVYCVCTRLIPSVFLLLSARSIPPTVFFPDTPNTPRRTSYSSVCTRPPGQIFSNNS